MQIQAHPLPKLSQPEKPLPIADSFEIDPADLELETEVEEPEDSFESTKHQVRKCDPVEVAKSNTELETHPMLLHSGGRSLLPTKEWKVC